MTKALDLDLGDMTAKLLTLSLLIPTLVKATAQEATPAPAWKSPPGTSPPALISQTNDNGAAIHGPGENVAPSVVKELKAKAEEGDAESQRKLAKLYHSGDGVTKDMAEAAKWWRKAAEQNEAWAQCNLGGCYMFGEGVAKNYVEAYKWTLLAAGQGDENAKKGCAY